MRAISRNAKLLPAGLVALALLAALPCISYRQYLYVVAWYCIHGNHAQVAGHTVTLPLLWWEEKDTLHWDSYILKRACAGFVCLQPEIDVTHVILAEQATVQDTDTAELEWLRERVSIANARIHGRQFNTAVTLRTKGMTLYCDQIGFSLPSLGAFVGSDCRAARVPYAFDFHTPTIEAEADSILSTLQ